MPAFLVTVRRACPTWGPSRPLGQQADWPARAAFMDEPLADEQRVVHAFEAESEDAVRATFARDPRSESHLHVDTIESWMVRLDGRSR